MWKANILRENLQQIVIIWVSDKHIIISRAGVGLNIIWIWPALTFCDSRRIFAKTCSVKLSKLSEAEWENIIRDTSHVTRDHVQTKQPDPSWIPPVAQQPPELPKACQARLPGPQRLVNLSFSVCTFYARWLWLVNLEKRLEESIHRNCLPGQNYQWRVYLTRKV